MSVTNRNRYSDTGQDTTGSPFDNLAAQYDSWYEEEGSLPYSIEVQALKQASSGVPRPWLEIGVGSGRFAQALDVDAGVDPSSGLLKIARSRGIEVLQGRGEQLMVQSESFGTVFIVLTLCFVESPIDTLREARRVLVPGGKLVLGMVLKESPWGALYMQKKEQHHPIYKYATFYGFGEVVRLIVHAGFLPERIVSTLFQKPGDVHTYEEPREGYFHEAGFAVLVAAR